MKFYCDIDGLEENWVDVSEKWTRREAQQVRRWDFKDNDEFWSVFAGKVEGLHLVNELGGVINTPAEMTDEFLFDCDERLAGFLGNILTTCVDRLSALGNAHARLSLTGTEPAR